MASDLLGSFASPLVVGLGPLQDNGGLTFTMMPLPHEIVIDRGTSGGLATDQRGKPRTYDAYVVNPAGGDGSDIGAVEVQGPVITSQPQAVPVCALRGSNVTFTVSASGETPLTYDWRRADYSQVSYGPSSSYTIPNAQAADAGGYFVLVSDDYGFDAQSQTATLTLGSSLGANVNGGGSLLKNPDQGLSCSNMTVQVTAVASAGWSFDHWSGDASGTSNPLTVLVNSDKSITANFIATLCAGAPLPSGLISWWRGEYDCRDATANNPGGYSGGITFGPGKVGRAFSFDPNVQPAVTALASPSLKPTEAVTIEAWVKPSSLPNLFPTVVRKNYNSTGIAQYFLSLTDAGQAHCSVGTFVSLTGGSVPIGQWSHLACTYDRQNLRLYVNGVQVALASATQPIPGPTFGSLYIGADAYSYDMSFDGLIDEPAIYNRALSAAEIQAIFNADTSGKCLPICTPAASGLVSWWPGAGNANDIAGNNNGMLEEMSFVPGKVGQAFNFSGSGSDVLISANPSLAFLTQFTLEAWIKPGDVNGYRQIFSRFRDLPSNSWHYQMGLAPNGRLRMDISGNNTTYDFLESSDAVLAVNTWTHVAATFDSGAMKLYVNGTEVASKTSGVTSIFNGTTTTALIGCTPQGNQRFIGVIDEMSAYGRLLTAAEILAIYNAGSAGKCLTPLYITSISKSGNNVDLWWLAQKGMSYRAQSKSNLNAATPWTDLIGDVTATGSTGSKTDIVPANALQRFYRVELLP